MKYHDLIEIHKNFKRYEDFYEYFPNLLKLKDTPQDKYYHAEGDVWTHTKMVCDELIGLKEYQLANDEEKFVMFYAALLHDVSKSITTKEDKGKIISPGHSQKGAVDTRIELWKAEVPFEIREQICNIINNHQTPFFAFNSRPINFNNIVIEITPEFIANKLSHQLRIDLLINVAKADMLGRNYAKKQDCMNDIELFKELCLENNTYHKPKEFPNNHTKVKYFRSFGQISPDHSFYKNSGSEVYMMCAIPASGKNTYVDKHLNNLPVISFDDMKEEIEKNDLKGSVYGNTIEKAKELLRNKESFVWNSTNLSQQMRSKTLNLLYGYNASVDLVYLEETYDVIRKRNNERNTTLKNDKIDEMLFKWEVPTNVETDTVEYKVNLEKKNKLKIK